MPTNSRRRAALVSVCLILFAACQSSAVPTPTAVPTETVSATRLPTAQPSLTTAKATSSPAEPSRSIESSPTAGPSITSAPTATSRATPTAVPSQSWPIVFEDIGDDFLGSQIWIEDGDGSNL